MSIDYNPWAYVGGACSCSALGGYLLGKSTKPSVITEESFIYFHLQH